MEIGFTENENCVYVTVNEELTVKTSPDFQQKVGEKLIPRKKLVIDISNMPYTSSAGLRAILTLQRMMANSDLFVLKSPNEEVMNVLDETGLSRIIKIEQ